MNKNKEAAGFLCPYIPNMTGLLQLDEKNKRPRHCYE